MCWRGCTSSKPVVIICFLAIKYLAIPRTILILSFPSTLGSVKWWFYLYPRWGLCTSGGGVRPYPAQTEEAQGQRRRGGPGSQRQARERRLGTRHQWGGGKWLRRQLERPVPPLVPVYVFYSDPVKVRPWCDGTQETQGSNNIITCAAFCIIS